MYMCLDVACPLCSTCLQKCSACAPVLSSHCWCAFFVVAKPCVAPSWLRELRSRQSHRVRSRRVSGFWRRAAIQKKGYRAAGSCFIRSGRIGKETTCVEVPPYPKDTTAQSQVQGLVAGPILQRYLGWISSGPAIELESNP